MREIFANFLHTQIHTIITSVCYIFVAPQSVNIVNEIAILLRDIAYSLGRSGVSLNGVAGKAIQALIELCAGNFSNQQVVFNAQILGTVSKILMEEVS